MKLTVAPIPEDQDFEPGDHGWIRVREPTLEATMLPVLPLAVVLGLGALLLWLGLTPLTSSEINVWWSLGAIPFRIPLHEVSHALAFPAAGWSDASFEPVRFRPRESPY